ncbi:O-antigen ligase, partial [Meiothermus sp.]|uniref:O-antigen ligase family protein n=1 Tax=Meiothermus sp. TaxID=1955249 RepID=UPI0025EC6078
FFMNKWYPLEPGKTYTQSFYLRHDGREARLRITFFTQRGHHPVPTQKELVAPGVWRVWASYTAQEGDSAVRAIDFFNEGGDYTYLEVGWPQLEEGSRPTPYRLGPTLKGLEWRLGWWVGAALLGFLVLQAGVWLLRVVPPSVVAWGVLLGMLAHLGYAGWQWLEAGPGARAAGLTPQPNFLGHGAVAAAGLVWALGGRRLGGVALAVAAATLWLSGSRTAFWALLLLGAAWGWSLGRYRWLALGAGGLLAGVALAEPELLGRLAQALTLDSNAQARLQFWQVAWQAFREHPLGGVGFGHFPLYFDLHPPRGAIEYSPGHAHNLGLQLLAEGGLLALVALGLWLAGVGWALARRRAWAALTLLGAVLLLNTTDFTFFSAWVYYPFLLAVAGALGPSANSHQAPIKPG